MSSSLKSEETLQPLRSSFFLRLLLVDLHHLLGRTLSYSQTPVGWDLCAYSLVLFLQVSMGGNGLNICKTWESRINRLERAFSFMRKSGEVFFEGDQDWFDKILHILKHRKGTFDFMMLVFRHMDITTLLFDKGYNRFVPKKLLANSLRV